MKKNWINAYSQPNVRKFQEGGAMGAPEEGVPAEGGAAPAPAGGAADIDAMLAEYAQTRDPQLAVAICDTLVEMMAGGAAPAGPEGGAPMARNGAKLRRGPVFRK